MRSARVGRWTRLAALACVISGLAAACSLNPQPIPPGADDTNNFGSDAGSKQGTGASADGSAIVDSGMPPTNSDSGPIATLDGGALDGDGAVSGDAGDAGEDADAGDAATDAPLDALAE